LEGTGMVAQRPALRPASHMNSQGFASSLPLPERYISSVCWPAAIEQWEKNPAAKTNRAESCRMADQRTGRASISSGGIRGRFLALRELAAGLHPFGKQLAAAGDREVSVEGLDVIMDRVDRQRHFHGDLALGV